MASSKNCIGKFGMSFIISRSSDILGICIAIAVVIGSFSQAPDIPGGEGSDKVVHLLAYGILAFFALLRRQTRRGALAMILAVIALGFMIEVLQPFVGREREIADAMANSAGATVGAMLAFIRKRIRALV